MCFQADISGDDGGADGYVVKPFWWLHVVENQMLGWKDYGVSYQAPQLLSRLH